MAASYFAQNKKTNDKAIRPYLIDRLNNNNGIRSCIVEEFDIENGVNRIDIVCIQDSSLHGYEIKSDLDTLTRLPNQVTSYNKIFGKVTLVVGYEHVNKAIYLIPDWWGITIAKYDGRDNIVFSAIREASPNPAINDVALSKLLLKDELVRLLRVYNPQARCKSLPKSRLFAELEASVDNITLRKDITHTLYSRYA